MVRKVVPLSVSSRPLIRFVAQLHVVSETSPVISIRICEISEKAHKKMGVEKIREEYVN